MALAIYLKVILCFAKVLDFILLCLSHGQVVNCVTIYWLHILYTSFRDETSLTSNYSFFFEYICLLLKRKENQTQHEVNMATLFYKYKIRILKQICKRDHLVGKLSC